MNLILIPLQFTLRIAELFIRTGLQLVVAIVTALLNLLTALASRPKSQRPNTGRALRRPHHNHYRKPSKRRR